MRFKLRDLLNIDVCGCAVSMASDEVKAAIASGESVEKIEKLIAERDRLKYEFVKKETAEALVEYYEATDEYEDINCIEPIFVERMAHDSVYDRKKPLRELLRKHGDFNEIVDGIVVNGRVDHEPNRDVIDILVNDLINPAFYSLQSNGDYDRAATIAMASRYFYLDDYHGEYLTALNRIAPHAYHEGRKITKIFHKFAEAIGVVNNAKGSEWNRKYALLCDEYAEKSDITVCFSIGLPAFMTMSNPYDDLRGPAMVSCHSLNSEHSYKAGCAGYARDGVTIIAYTCKDISNQNSRYTRKTMRQLFEYRPGSGLLLQSRLYKCGATAGEAYGGTIGKQPESKVLRELLEKIISECEGKPNLWRSFPYCGNDEGINFYDANGFGGYSDYDYSKNAPMVAILKERDSDCTGFPIGAQGRCWTCGDLDNTIQCYDCQGAPCAYCGDRYNEGSMYEVYDEDGCERLVCGDCYSRYYSECTCCGQAHETSYMHEAIDSWGDIVMLCEDCSENGEYHECPDCGRLVHIDDECCVHDDCGDEMWVCPDCRDSNYTMCDDCHEYYPDSEMEDKLCPDCCAAREENENSEDTEDKNEEAIA